MANSWNELSWGQGDFGQQNNSTVPVTSAVDSPLAWNVGNFGSPSSFGGIYDDIGISLGDETTAGEINSGWGRRTWGDFAWGIDGSLLLTGQQLNISAPGALSFIISGSIDVTGQQLNTSINDVYAFGLAIVNPTGLQLNIAEGNIDPAPDAEVTGQQLNITQGSVTVSAEINSGWGRRGWGIYDWGSDGLSVITSVTGQQLNITQGDESSSANADVNVNSISPVGWGVVYWGTQKWGESQVDLTQTISEGIVDPAPDANVTGQQINLFLNDVSIIGTANLSLTGQILNITQGTAEGKPNTIASVTGRQLNIAQNSVVAGASAEVYPTGNRLTIQVNSINVQIWTEISTGTDATWSNVSTGSTATWTKIDTAA